MNNYTKFFIDLVNVDVAIKLVLLYVLPDEEYETFILILINGKQTLNYNNVLVALVK